jgi:hypothetical protein
MGNAKYCYTCKDKLFLERTRENIRKKASKREEKRTLQLIEKGL